MSMFILSFIHALDNYSYVDYMQMVLSFSVRGVGVASLLRAHEGFGGGRSDRVPSLQIVKAANSKCKSQAWVGQQTPKERITRPTCRELVVSGR